MIKYENSTNEVINRLKEYSKIKLLEWVQLIIGFMLGFLTSGFTMVLTIVYIIAEYLLKKSVKYVVLTIIENRINALFKAFPLFMGANILGFIAAIVITISTFIFKIGFALLPYLFIPAIIYGVYIIIYKKSK